MKKKLPCYLKTYRKRAGLTQKQLALLLGVGCDTTISKLERRAREPNLKIAVGCQILFGVRAEDIFPEVFSRIGQEIETRARQQSLPDKRNNYDETVS